MARLEALIARNSRITLPINGGQRYFDCKRIGEKRELFAALYGYLRSMKSDIDVRRMISTPATRPT